MNISKLKRLAYRNGYSIKRNPRAIRLSGYDREPRYMIVSVTNNAIEPGCEALTLHEVEKWLKS